MRWKRVLAIGAVAVALGAVGAVSATLLAYHDATKIDRSNPKVVLSEYLRASLVRKDKVGAELYSCSDQEKFAAVRILRDELDQRERDFGVSVVVEWGAQDRVDQGDKALLTTGLSIIAIKNGVEQSSSEQRWRFTLINDDGWRVCGAERLPSPTPTPTSIPATTRSPAAP
ncbi:hypothetical protein [Allorhizocola rhizosphaerae]|uniref:hypothetical protein n=1 Tax=Allorhizocola rhizosphaerae TaxID=1872709 RepID=UPI0013C2ED8A|nr:hypothetical protein [Allorhizocola rhizosphaerae]